MLNKIGLTVLIFILASCTPGAKSVSPVYVSPLEYSAYDCEQISAEIRRVSRRSSELAGQVDQIVDGENTAQFWGLPSGNESIAKKQEYARLLGQFEALEQASIEKKCGIKTIRN